MAINHQRVGELLIDEQKAMHCDEARRLYESIDALQKTLVGTIPFDWRYNAVHWAVNVQNICLEIRYSIAWMRAFARYSSECEADDRWSAEGHVSYYGDNAATRISSCRDKIALLAWSYYCPFNPDKKDEILSFEPIRERFTNPIRFGLKLGGHQAFLAELNKLIHANFERALGYRHRKVHKMEPRVMLRKPEKPDHLSYMVTLTTDKEIRIFDDELAITYPDERFRAAVRERCFQDGVLFDRRAPDQLLWYFNDFDEFAYSCWKSLCDAAAGSCQILLGREPLLSKDKPRPDV